MKGLTVVENVAYFGIAEFGDRSTRDSQDKTSEVAAFDLHSRRLLWRTTVETHGLLNVVVAPHVAEWSTYLPVANWNWTPGKALDVKRMKAEVRAGVDGAAISSFGRDQSQQLQEQEQHLHGEDGHQWGFGKTKQYRDRRPRVGFAPSGVAWMDLRAKQNMPSDDKDLLIQHGDVDVSVLKAILDANPDFCRESSQLDNAKLTGRKGNMDMFKPGVDSVHLIFSDYEGSLVFKFPYFSKYERELLPLINSVMRDHFGIENPMQHVMRLQFACMNPGSKILKHTDRGGWVKHGHRIHIPLVVPESAGGA